MFKTSLIPIFLSTCMISKLIECRPEFRKIVAPTACQSGPNGLCEDDMHPAPKSKARVPLILARTVPTAPQCDPHAEEKSSEYWIRDAQMTLQSHLIRQQNTKKAKNIIMFLGDGMSIPTLAAARTYLGQLNNQRGEESHLSFEQFPYVGLSKTFCIDKQVADSACSATAYLCGVKANFFTIGVNGNVDYDDCEASMNPINQVSSLASWAQKAGKGTGIVTTTTVTHASPSGAYAHVANRMWESDADVKKYEKDSKTCQDIAKQLIYGETGKNLDVVLGGGRKKFIPATEKDEEGKPGERLDGVNLIENWKMKNKNGRYIFNKKGLQSVNYEKTDKIFGLFANNHMAYYLDADHDKEPTLKEMTEAAIKVLEKKENGFFLFVEGGRIDHGHHESKAAKALAETVQLSEAVQRAVEMTSREDTLIVVTSDHAHTMTIAGYPDRGNDILGLNTFFSDVDNLPYTTLTYANGAGANAEDNKNPDGSRKDLTKFQFHKDYRYAAAVPTKIESHGGDDVGVFALGPQSHLLSGVYGQQTIPHIMAYAACIGDHATACNSYA